MLNCSGCIGSLCLESILADLQRHTTPAESGALIEAAVFHGPHKKRPGEPGRLRCLEQDPRLLGGVFGLICYTLSCVSGVLSSFGSRVHGGGTCCFGSGTIV